MIWTYVRFRKDDYMSKKEIVMIEVDHIHPHPDNPRKGLGDLSELAESIKKKGIMQNLTVVPKEDEPGEYTVIIGHRRHGAATMAGIQEVPCVIVEDMSAKEQVSTMLEENMQRNDLTIWEQAQGFQMMIDLGDTEEEIAEKTGFSKTTIRHRLNIAKLDQDELREKEQDENFQLSLKDLYELEKVDDIEVRNKILKDATDNRNLVFKVQNHLKTVERNKKTKKIVSMLEEKGIEKAPKDYEKERYSGKWETVKEYRVDGDNDVPKRIQIDKKDDEPLYYFSSWYGIIVVKKSKKKKKELSPEEKRRKQIMKNKKEINELIKKMDERRREFILNIFSGKIDSAKDEKTTKDALWYSLILSETSLYPSNMMRVFTGKGVYDCTQEEKDEASKKVSSLSVENQMLSALHYGMEYHGDITDWQGQYNERVGQALMDGYKVLGFYGWSFESEEEKQILDGTHPLYTREDDEND